MQCIKSKYNSENLKIPEEKYQQEEKTDRLYSKNTIGTNAGRWIQSLGYCGFGPNGASADADIQKLRGSYYNSFFFL